MRFRSVLMVCAAWAALVTLPAARALAGGTAPGASHTAFSHSKVRPDPEGITAFTAQHPNAAAGIAKPYSGTPVDALTYHYDNARTGWNPAETDLTPASVGSAKFGLLQTLAVDGNVFAQPLLVSNFVMPDGSTHNVLIVATAHNTVYAYDAQTYAILWQVSLGPSQSAGDVGCGDVMPEYGISSTPVIVRSAANSATIYVVDATEPQHLSFQTALHALDLGTGADMTPAVTIAPSAVLSDGSTLGFSAKNQWVRAGLAYNNGSLYVGIGSHCDNDAGNISGWLLRYGSRLKLRGSFHTIENPAGYELSSIWMTGFAPAIDATGRVFVVTGNGDFNIDQGGNNYGESVLGLLGNLSRIRTSFTPNDYVSLNRFDTDFGSGGVMLIPPVAGQVAPPLAVAMGKASQLYLLDSTHLGGRRASDAGALQVQSGSGGLWGGPAYYVGPAGGTVFAQGDQGKLTAYAVDTGAQPSLTRTVTGTTKAGYGGSLPIVSSNGTAANTGVVWLVRRAGTVQLEAYDASRLGSPIYTAAAGTWSNPDNNAFVTPLEANGRVYVGATNSVKVFGLTP